MREIELVINEFNQAVFIIEAGERIGAELRFVIIARKIIAYHTQVSRELQGQGIAKQLLDQLVSYARNKHYMIMVLCPYVSGVFQKNPELYADIWDKEIRPIIIEE